MTRVWPNGWSHFSIRRNPDFQHNSEYLDTHYLAKRRKQVHRRDLIKLHMPCHQRLGGGAVMGIDQRRNSPVITRRIRNRSGIAVSCAIIGHQLARVRLDHLQQEGVAIAKGLSKLMDREPADPDVQTLIARQHAWIENFYPVDADVFRGLGDLYTTNSEFRAHYDQYTPGLADFMCNAMTHYAETVLEAQRNKE